MEPKTTGILKDKRILITGVCGTVGSRLLRHLVEREEVQGSFILGVDSNENGVFELEARYEHLDNVHLVVGNVRDRLGLERLMTDVDVVFHCAALKHVYQCEKAPTEALQTNILGVEAIIAASLRCGVEKVIFTSSDKAVNPTSVMGTSKLMGERLITAANVAGSGRTIFASTRFGNVLGSNGSVVKVFHKQIANGGPVTLTSSEMTRFVMGIDAAVSLVVRSAGIARGGEVFITKMPVIAIRDLAKVMIDELAPRYGHKPEDIEVVVTGPRPGEKLYEELMTGEETRRALELQEYFVILPAFRPVYKGIHYQYPDMVRESVARAYVSGDEPLLPNDELRRLMVRGKMLD